MQDADWEIRRRGRRFLAMDEGPERERAWRRHKAELQMIGYTYLIMGIVMAIITIVAVVVAVKGG